MNAEKKRKKLNEKTPKKLKKLSALDCLELSSGRLFEVNTPTINFGYSRKTAGFTVEEITKICAKIQENSIVQEIRYDAGGTFC